MAQRLVSLVVGLVVAGVLASLLCSVRAGSSARIVRISYLKGDALVEHDPTHKDLNHAAVNVPITSGLWLYTPDAARVEVQFEDGNSLRVVNDSTLTFESLSLDDSGGRLDAIRIHHGTIYFDFDRMRTGDRLKVRVAGNEFEILKSAHLRILADPTKIQIAVFHGKITMNGEHPVEVDKDETISIETARPQAAAVQRGIEKLPTDKWDREREARSNAIGTPAETPADYHKAGERAGRWRTPQIGPAQ